MQVLQQLILHSYPKMSTSGWNISELAQNLANRITIADVAKRAGVSTATVDRVINRRRPVKPETTEAVEAAARDLGFYATSLIKMRALSRARPIKIGFILQKHGKSFYRKLGASLETAANSLTEFNASCKIEFVDELSPTEIVEAMRRLSAEVESMAVVALDHPHVVDEVRRLKTSGIPTWALLSGISSPDIAGYIGVDGRKAGRTAAWALERCARRGSAIGVIIGSHRYSGHEDREGGLRSYFRERSAGFELIQSLTYLDDDQGAYESALELLSSRPDLGGLYVIGGGAAGAVKAFREEGVGNKIALVCHELINETRNGLIDGIVDLVLDSPVEAIANAAVSLLAAPSANERSETRSAIIPFNIYVSENI